MDERFLNKYEKEEFERIGMLLDDSYNNLSFSIIYPVYKWEEHLLDKDYLRAFMRMLDFFEMSIQYCSALIIGYLRKEENLPKDENIERIINLIPSKPLSFGDWVNDIFIPLVNKSSVYLPENDFVQSLNSVLFGNKKGNILQGFAGKTGDEHKSIVALRNEYYGHASFLDNEIYKQVTAILEERLWIMLEALQPLQALTSFAVDKVVDADAETKIYTLMLLKGVDENKPVKATSTLALKKNSYYVSTKEIRRLGSKIEPDHILEISPLVIYHHSDDEIGDQMFTYIFQSVVAQKLSRLTYVSSHEKAKRKETELFKDEFFALLTQFVASLRLDKQSRISITRNWNELLEMMNIETNSFIRQMGKGKYDSELFVPRKLLSDYYKQFVDSDKKLFPILGNAGIGKTNQICYWAEQLVAQGKSVLTLGGNQFSSDNLEQKFQKIFKISNKNIEEILQLLHDKSVEEKKIVYFFFDALNECQEYKGGRGRGKGAIDLLDDINRYIIHEKFSNFKVILTCRNYTWEELVSKETDNINQRLYFVAEENKELSIHGFNDDELREAYGKYSSKFGLKTTVDELFEDKFAFVRLRLSDPLILKISALNFQGTYLPNETVRFNAISLFNLKIKELEKKELFILEEFASVLWAKKTDHLTMRLLYFAYEDGEDTLNPLSQKLFTDDSLTYSPAFLQLLDGGVLRVSGTFEKLELQFVFERFLEFMLARVFVEQEKSKFPNRQMAIPGNAYLQIIQKFGQQVVFMGAMRNALIMDYIDSGKDPSAILTIAQSTVYESYPLVIDTLKVLMNENYTEVFNLLMKFAEFRREESEDLENEYVRLAHSISSSRKHKKDTSSHSIEDCMSEQKKVYDQMFPIISVRKIATVSVNEIFKSEIFNKNLYDTTTDPHLLLWRLMADPIGSVRDYVSLYIYYISRYNHQLGYEIVDLLSQKVLNQSILPLLKSNNRKELISNYIEPAARISLIMVIDGLVERNDTELALKMLDTWREIIRRYTLNFSLIRLVMPFLQFFMRRQGTIQTEYVNNGIEYQHYFDEIPPIADAVHWGRNHYKTLSEFLKNTEKGIEKYHSVVLDAYTTGDSFSYFLLERVMIVQGYYNWEAVCPVVSEFFSKYSDNKYFDYSQMSMLYVLFHIIEKSTLHSPEIITLFNHNCVDWTARTHGLFEAHNNRVANNGRPYKQYVMNWYGVIYCKIYGDGNCCKRDITPVPLLFDLLKKAFDNRDKELFYNCIENVSVLVSDFGYYKTALLLFEYILGLFKYESEIYEFDSISTRREDYNVDVRSFLIKMLGTIKNYFPREVNYFVTNKLKNSTFPNIEQYREEIINYNQSSEGIGDLLTHKFGNFIIWSLLNNKQISEFFVDGFKAGSESKDYIDWVNRVLKIALKLLFEIKV